MTQDNYIPMGNMETLLRYLKIEGADVAGVMRETGFNPQAYQHKISPMPLNLFEAVNRRGETLLDDPLFALRAAASTDGDEYEWAKYAVVSLVNPRAALVLSSEFYNQMTIPVEMRFLEGARKGTVVLKPTTQLIDALKIYLEFQLGLLCALVTNILRLPARPSLVELGHPARAEEAAYEQTFGCPVQFNAPRTAIVFPNKVLDTPAFQPDSTLAEIASQELMRVIRAYSAGRAGITELVLTFLNTAKGPAEWQLKAVAEKLFLPARTLQHRIGQADTSFKDLVETVRRGKAGEYLEAGHEQGEIAHWLGYTDVASFRKAFQRWYGEAPGIWRKGRDITPGD